MMHTRCYIENSLISIVSIQPDIYSVNKYLFYLYSVLGPSRAVNKMYVAQFWWGLLSVGKRRQLDISPLKNLKKFVLPSTIAYRFSVENVENKGKREKNQSSLIHRYYALWQFTATSEINLKCTSGPGWCGSVDWVPAWEPKGCQFNSQ